MFRTITTISKCKTKVKILALCSTLILSAINVSAKDWRGVVPLRSSRADVERLLGSPGEHGRYQFENERAYVEYSSRSCHDGDNCLCLVPNDMVLNVYVQMETIVRFSSIKLDNRRYEKFISPENSEIVTYSNREEGVIYTVNRALDAVVAINYIPAARDCEAYLHKTVSFTLARPRETAKTLGQAIKIDAQHCLAVSATANELNLIEARICPNQPLFSDLNSALFS